MKYSKNREAKINKGQLVKILFFFLMIYSLVSPIFANELDLKLKVPKNSEEEGTSPSPIDIKRIPNHVSSIKKEDLKFINSIPINLRLKLASDNFINSRTSMLGDSFSAHVLEDLYLQTKPTQLIVPKGSWVRGRISFLKRPNFFSKTGKINFHLDQLITPLAEVVPLDAELYVQQGYTSISGLFEPVEAVDIKGIEPAVALLENLSGMRISVGDIGLPLIGELVNGPLTALYLQSQNISINKGQELQILLKKDIQLITN